VNKTAASATQFLNVNYIMHKTGICTVYVISTGLKLEIHLEYHLDVKCILFHTYSRTTAAPIAARTQTKTL